MSRFLLIVLASLVALIIAMSVAVALGAATMPLSTVWSVVLNKLYLTDVTPVWTKGQENIVWDVRMPRVLLAACVGAGLAVVGAVLQPLTRNPLADPHLLGVSSGALFGAILALLHVGLIFGLITVPLFAFFGALASTAMVLMVARFTDSGTADRLVLSGVAVSLIVAALANLLIFLGDPRAQHTVVFWMLGGLGLAQWNQLIYPSAVLAICFGILMAQTRSLNGLALGDETATSLGLQVNRLRLELFTLTALLTGVMVAFSGAIGFVGLMVPHIARLLVGSDNVKVLPVSALIGAIGLVLADLLARIIMRPEDMPIGVVTGLVGGVAFVILLRRR